MPSTSPPTPPLDQEISAKLPFKQNLPAHCQPEIALSPETRYVLYRLWSLDPSRGQDLVAHDAHQILSPNNPNITAYDLNRHLGRAYVLAHDLSQPLPTYLRQQLSLLENSATLRLSPSTMSLLIPTLSRLETSTRATQHAKDAASWQSYTHYILLQCYGVKRNRGAYNTWNDFVNVGLEGVRREKMIDAKMLFYELRAEGGGKSLLSLGTVVERMKKRIPEEDFERWEGVYGERTEAVLAIIRGRAVD
jgi:hypothetical protein